METFAEGAGASLELMLQVSGLMGYIASQHGIDPLSPSNHGSIDKSKQTQITFISDLKK